MEQRVHESDRYGGEHIIEPQLPLQSLGLQSEHAINVLNDETEGSQSQSCIDGDGYIMGPSTLKDQESTGLKMANNNMSLDLDDSAALDEEVGLEEQKREDIHNNNNNKNNNNNEFGLGLGELDLDDSIDSVFSFTNPENVNLQMGEVKEGEWRVEGLLEGEGGLNEKEGEGEEREEGTDSRPISPEHAHLTAEEQIQMEKMKAENEQVLLRMSMLMKNMAFKKDVQEEKPKRAEQVEVVRVERPKREDYGLDIKELKRWKSEQEERALQEEENRQEVAVTKVRGFLDGLRMITRLQSWWRMMTFKIEFREFRNARLDIKRIFYIAWKRYWQAEHMYVNL